MPYKTSYHRISIEGDKITLICRDTRLIAEHLDEKYMDSVYKHMSTTDFETFLEEITAEFWKAGVEDGKESARKKIASVKQSIDDLFEGKLIIDRINKYYDKFYC